MAGTHAGANDGYHRSLQTTALLSLSCAVLSHSVVSDSLQPHGRYLARLLCPSGFSRQECWSGLPCPPPGDLLKPGTKPRSPTLQVNSSPSEPPGKPKNTGVGSLTFSRGLSRLRNQTRVSSLQVDSSPAELLGKSLLSFSAVQLLSHV